MTVKINESRQRDRKEVSMSFLNLMRNRLKPKEVNDALVEVNEALVEVEGRVLPVTTSASTGQMLGLTGESKTPAWVDNLLPTPTALDNGKVLGVNDGSYAFVNVSTDVTFLSLMSAREVVQLKAKDEDPSHEYIGVKIGSGEWTYYEYSSLPDLSQYGLTIVYDSPYWIVKLFNFFTIDGNDIYYYNSEVKWQWEEEKYSHTFAGYNIPAPTQSSRKKKSSK